MPQFREIAVVVKRIKECIFRYLAIQTEYQGIMGTRTTTKTTRMSGIIFTSLVIILSLGIASKEASNIKYQKSKN